MTNDKPSLHVCVNLKCDLNTSEIFFSAVSFVSSIDTLLVLALEFLIMHTWQAAEVAG